MRVVQLLPTRRAALFRPCKDPGWMDAPVFCSTVLSKSNVSVGPTGDTTTGNNLAALLQPRTNSASIDVPSFPSSVSPKRQDHTHIIPVGGADWDMQVAQLGHADIGPIDALALPSAGSPYVQDKSISSFTVLTMVLVNGALYKQNAKQRMVSPWWSGDKEW